MAMQLHNAKLTLLLNGKEIAQLDKITFTHIETSPFDPQPPKEADAICTFSGISGSISFQLPEGFLLPFKLPRQRPNDNRLRKFVWRNGRLVEVRARGRTGHRSLIDAIRAALGSPAALADLNLDVLEQRQAERQMLLDRKAAELVAQWLRAPPTGEQFVDPQMPRGKVIPPA